MSTRRNIAEAAMAALKKAGEAPPRKQFGKMVRAGVINREGRITTLYGGKADPDLSAVLETLKARTPTSVVVCPPSGVGHASGNLAVARESSQRNLRRYSAYSRSGRRSMVISKAQYEKLLAAGARQGTVPEMEGRRRQRVGRTRCTAEAGKTS